MTFIDVHCHIDLCKDKAEKIIERAREAGVGVIVNNGVYSERNRKTLELASKFKEVKAALGCYPTDAIKLSDKDVEDEIKFILKNKNSVAAIGEVGLDLKEENSNLEKQKDIFKKFIDLSIKLDVPVIVHSRKAEKEAIELLEKMEAKKVIMHCFMGKFSLVKRIRDNGWHFSVPGIVKYSEQFQKLVKDVPLAQLFCETDSPYLHPDREMNNEPANVVESYKKIAEIKGISLEECEKKIEENYQKLFKKTQNIKP